ncbi:MAG: ABC transporter ATP-binding protein [Gemmatimonadota bacterium]|nr:ABC transporter ATP-binding protein [Gemmatimonadota bacterium]MDH3424073.1 ABC transporter ATP-binding protein [Gemmatimonadota bacterium]
MIRAEGLEKSYTSGGRPLPVLRSIDLEIPAEAFVAIVGPSGSGKTTLLGLLAGLDQPTEGRVYLDGVDISALTEDGRADFRSRNVGFVFQTFHLLPTLTAVENVLVPLELRGNVSGAGERAAALLDRVGLAARLDHYPAQLSGGEQQRVALARAFANEPKILFADEPTGNLDQETGGGIVEIMEELNRDSRTTLVLVTHDLALAERAHRVVGLSRGTIASDRPGTHKEPAGVPAGAPDRVPG